MISLSRRVVQIKSHPAIDLIFFAVGHDRFHASPKRARCSPHLVSSPLLHLLPPPFLLNLLVLLFALERCFIAQSAMMVPRPRLRLLPALRAPFLARRFATESRLASDHVRIVEVGPRDGLQNEKKSIPMETKMELIRKLAQTGVTTIEAGSFVPAKWVPQVRMLGATRSREFWED